MSSKNKIFLIGAILFIIGFILYLPNIKNGLFWDDADWITLNPYVHSLAWSNIKFIFTHNALAGIGLQSNYFRPFLFFTFLLDYLVSGVKPIIYHLTNNLIHIANALLLFFLLDKFLKKRSVAVIASLLFLIHPLQTEAVTYVSGRGDPMSVLFMLLAIVAFLRQSRWSKILSYIFAVLAVLSRETAVLFPLYLMVFLMAFVYPAPFEDKRLCRESKTIPERCGVYRERFWLSFKNAFRKALPFLGISLVYGISRLTVLNFQNTLNFYQQPTEYSTHLIYRILTFLHVIVVYFRLIFVPTGLHMEREILVNISLWQWPVWFGLLIILVIIYALFALYRKEVKDKAQISNYKSNPKSKGRDSSGPDLALGFGNLDLPKISHFRLWFFAWGFFFLNLAPTSGVFPINALLYEHWLYFSLFGFFALLAFYLDAIYVFLKKRAEVLAYILAILFLAYLGFLSVQTVRRNIIWGKTDVFYQNILKYEPQNIRVLNNLAMYYSENGRLKEAEEMYWKAVNSNDIMPAPYYNLGNILRDRKDYAGALELYKKSISVDPAFIYAYMNIASIYAGQGNLAGALEYLEKLKAIRPTDALVYWNIGRIQNALGQKAEAIQSMKDVLKYTQNNDNENVRSQAEQFLNGIK